MRYIGYRENQTRGTFGFPIQLYYVDYNHPQYEMPFHWHMECELILVLGGKFYLTVDGKQYILEKGDSAFIPGECIHGGTPSSCIYECVVFNAEQFLSASQRCLSRYNHSLESGIIRPTEFFCGTKAAGIVDCLFESMEKEDSAYSFTTTGLLWQLMGCMLSSHKAEPGAEAFPAAKNNSVKKVLTKIRTDYSKKITLSDLAHEANLNPQYFCKAFRAVTGKTPIDYLNYYRIECAAEQLCTSYRAVTDIALSCGFNDIGYFNRIFKRHKNMTPTQYRRKFYRQNQ